MICIKCGKQFSTTQKTVVCHKCKAEHLDTYGFLDATTNITLDDAKALRCRMETELKAVDMLIEGKSLAEIAEFMGKSKQEVSLFFSNKIRWALYARDKKEIKGGKNGKLPDKKIEYKPIWPENLYCAVFAVKEYPGMPVDAEDSIDYVLNMLSPREKDIIIKRLKEEGTLAEIAQEYELTGERVRQIECKALRKLRNSGRAKYLIKGVEAQQKLDEIERETRERLVAEIVAKKAAEQEQRLTEMRAAQEVEDANKGNLTEIRIEDMNLSVRAYGSLYRANVLTLAQLSEMTMQDLFRLRNIGRKSAEHIAFACSQYGVIIPDTEDIA